MLVRTQNKRNSYSLLMGMQNGTATLEDRLVVSYKAKHSLTMWSSNFTQMSWKLMSTENPHMNVYGSFIQNRQKLEAIKISFNKWMDKLWYIHTMEYCSVIKEISYQATKRHGGTLNAYCLAKEVNLKRLYTVWFQLHDISEKAKLKRQ